MAAASSGSTSQYTGTVDEIPDGFADAWEELMDLQVTFRQSTRPLRDWCCFETTIGHPRCVLQLMDPPEDGSVGWTLAFSVEQSDKSIFMYLMTTACCMLGIPSIIIVCETLENTRGVEGKMNGLRDAIRAAARDAGHDVAALSETLFMDGKQKNWDALDPEDFDRTLVVPGTYLAAVSKTASFLAEHDIRPQIFVDEGDKLSKTDFLMDARTDTLGTMDQCLQKMYRCARGVTCVTATPGAFLRWGQLNRLKFRAFVSDLDKLKRLGYEIGENIVHSRHCANVTDKDYDVLSGFFLPHHLAGVQEMRDLRGSARGLLAMWAINHAHNPSGSFSNYDMARILVHGNPEEKTYGRHTVEECEAWDPDAFAVVVVGGKAFVTCQELAGERAPGGWQGFKGFGKLGDKSPLDRAVDWIHETFEDAIDRPLHLFGYETFIRSFSPRFYGRCLTHLFSHLKKAKNTDCATQLGKRACGSNVPTQLLENGLTSCQVFSTPADFKVTKCYAAYMREILKYALDDYVPMEHVFEGGEPGKELPAFCAAMKGSKRGHWHTKQKAHGNPIGNIRLDPRSSRVIPGSEQEAARSAEYRAVLQAAAERMREVAEEVADVVAEVADQIDDAVEDVDEGGLRVLPNPLPGMCRLLSVVSFLVRAVMNMTDTAHCIAGMIPRDRLMVLFFNAVEGDVSKVMTLDELRTVPGMAEVIDAQGNSVRQRLVALGYLAQPQGSHSRQYKLTEEGRKYAIDLFQ